MRRSRTTKKTWNLPQTIDAQSVSSARGARAWTDAIARLSRNLRLYALRPFRPIRDCSLPYRGDCQITSDRSQPAVVAKLNSTLGISERATAVMETPNGAKWHAQRSTHFPATGR
jgi:hypothetical protein